MKDYLPSFFFSFTFMAFVLITMLGIGAVSQARTDSDEPTTNIKHSRQDLRLIAYLLGGVLIMLGVIADKLR